MRERLKNGPIQIKVDIESTFYNTPNRSLIAEIPGTVKPDERVVLAAHVQEPGANDDASGCGTLLAAAAALAQVYGPRALQGPGRTSRSCGLTRFAAASSGWAPIPRAPKVSNTCSRST